MARCRCLLALPLLLALPSRVVGQEPLTLDRALSAALAHNASLRASRAGVDEAVAGVTEARSGLFPRFSVTESWQRGDQPVFVFSSLLSARQFAATNFAIDALNHPDPIGFFRASLGAELNRLMGDPVEREVVAVEPSTFTFEDIAGQRDVTALLAEADAARPELKRAAASARTAEAAQRQARAALIPQVGAQAVFDVSGTRFSD